MSFATRHSDEKLRSKGEFYNNAIHVTKKKLDLNWTPMGPILRMPPMEPNQTEDNYTCSAYVHLYNLSTKNPQIDSLKDSSVDIFISLKLCTAV